MKKNFKNLKSILVITLALILALSVFTGCGKKGGKDGNAVNTSSSKYGTEYPLDAGDVTLTYWMPMSANIAESASNYGELPVAKKLQEDTGIKIEYIHPSLTNAAEKFNLMIASGELTDIIEYYWANYTGGAQMAIDDGIILPLNDMMEAGWAPDFTALMEQYPDTVAKEAKTDKGLYFSTGTVAPDRELNTTAGPIVRQDWLDELGLETPETIDDWYVMLKAFKEKKGATAPLSMTNQGFFNGFLAGAYGVNSDFYHDNNVVKYGPAEPGYKEFLATMHKWYEEGLYDNNFSTTDSTTITANLLNAKSGATWNALGGGIGVLTNAIKEKDPKAVFAGAPYPTLKEGEKPQFGQASPRFGVKAAITTQCKDPELAMKLLNYGYTEEGHMLFNFGIEGESYEWVDKDGEKYPQYTEEITANPNGLSMQQAFTIYSQAGQGGSYRQDVRYLEQYAALPNQQQAWKTWVDTDTFEHYVPSTGVANDVAKEYSNLYTAISTYYSEMFVKFITGDEPIENFDKFVEKLKDMGLDRMLEIKQDAFNAYLAR